MQLRLVLSPTRFCWRHSCRFSRLYIYGDATHRNYSMLGGIKIDKNKALKEWESKIDLSKLSDEHKVIHNAHMKAVQVSTVATVVRTGIFVGEVTNASTASLKLQIVVLNCYIK